MITPPKKIINVLSFLINMKKMQETRGIKLENIEIKREGDESLS
jgi:hypothetical protein